MSTTLSPEASVAIDLLADLIIQYLSSSPQAVATEADRNWIKTAVLRQMESEAMHRMERELLAQRFGTPHFRRIA